MVTEDIYGELIKKINYPDPKSERLLRIFRKLANPDEARLLLELPSEPPDLARKLGVSEDTVRKMIRELTEKGLIITTGKGPRMVRDVTQFHDANLASSEKWVDTELLDLWKDFYEVEWFPTMGNIPADAYVQYIRVVPAWTAIERSPDIAPGSTAERREPEGAGQERRRNRRRSLHLPPVHAAVRCPAAQLRPVQSRGGVCHRSRGGAPDISGRGDGHFRRI